MRFLSALLPRSRREWGEALLAESTHSDKATRWLIGSLRLIAWSWFDWIFGGNLMKTVVATLSTINVAMGIFLMGLFVFTLSDAPVALIMLAVGLTIQGGYTLWYLTSFSRALEPWSLRALLAGQTIAVLVGSLGFVTTTVNTLLRPPPVADPEYGPIVVGALIAAQAVATLYVYVVSNGRDQIEAPRPSCLIDLRSR